MSEHPGTREQSPLSPLFEDFKTSLGPIVHDAGMILKQVLGVLEAKKTSWPEEELRDIIFGVRFFGAFVHRESGDVVRKGIEEIIPKDWKKEVIILNLTAIAIFRFLVERAGNQFLSEQAEKFVESLPQGEPLTLTYDYRGPFKIEGESGELVDVSA